MSCFCTLVFCLEEAVPGRPLCAPHWAALDPAAQRVVEHYRQARAPGPEYALACSCARAVAAFRTKRWGEIRALDEVANASHRAQREDGVPVERVDEIVRSMGCAEIAGVRK